MQNLENQRVLRVPRGTFGLPELALDMTLLDEAEYRLKEVRIANPATQKDLEGLFNEAANKASTYLAWIKYEILTAEKQFALDKATVILEKAPEEFKKIKETGIKFNEDFREALIARDEMCQRSLDIINSLKAVEALLESKIEAFIRAHYSSRNIAETKGTVLPSPNFSGAIGQTYNEPQKNFMGDKSGFKKY